jgi:hypothetical protein
MSDFDHLTELLHGRGLVTAEQIADAERHLGLLRSLRAEAWRSGWTIIPPPTGAWRSAAADRYAERLAELQSLVIAARDAIDGAEESLERCLARMRDQLAARLAQSGDVAR